MKFITNQNRRDCSRFEDWSPFSECLCSLRKKIKVRIPSTNQRRDENLDGVIRLYRKLTSKSNQYNNDDDGVDESDLDVRDIEDQDHPCFGEELIRRTTCGQNNKHCVNNDNDMYGMPGINEKYI